MQNLLSTYALFRMQNRSRNVCGCGFATDLTVQHSQTIKKGPTSEENKE